MLQVVSRSPQSPILYLDALYTVGVGYEGTHWHRTLAQLVDRLISEASYRIGPGIHKTSLEHFQYPRGVPMCSPGSFCIKQLHFLFEGTPSEWGDVLQRDRD